MLRFVREGYNFSLDTRTVAWPDTLDLSVVKGRIRQTVAEDFVRCFVGIACPALQLFKLAWLADEREAVKIVFSVLHFHVLEVYASCIDADWRTGLHAVGSNAMSGDGFS